MYSVREISKSDYYSILKWSDIGVPFVEKPTDDWFEYVSRSIDVICVCLRQNDEVMAYCQADIVNNAAAVSVVTNPTALRKGFGTKILGDLCLILKSRGVEKMEASVELENTASSLLAEKLGFHIVGSEISDPGFIEYQKYI